MRSTRPRSSSSRCCTTSASSPSIPTSSTGPGPLDDRQRERMRRHTIEGEELLAGIAGLEHLAPAVRATHEAWDGSGYPDGLAGDEIPLTARIVTVVDAFDAMTSERAYRKPLPAPRGAAPAAGRRGPAVRPARGRRHPARPLTLRAPLGAALAWGCARAARGRDHRAPPGRRAARRRRRVGAGAGHQRAEDLRPAAAGARGRRRSSGVRRIGKHLVVDVAGDLALLVHLMSAGRLQLFDKRAALRDRTSRLLVRLDDGRELRLREFGTKQAAWVKVLRAEDVAADDAHRDARARGVARPAAAARAARRRRAPRPLHARAARPARDRRHRALVGRRDPVDGDAVAVQARRRPRRRRGRRRCARRSSSASTARSSTTSASSRCRSPTSCRCRCRSIASRASRARAAARRSRPSTTRTTSCATARTSRPAGACSRTAGCRAC